MYQYASQLHHYLEHSASSFPEKVALIVGKQTIRYKQLDQEANKFAHYLRSIGVTRGDRVVCAIGNTYVSVIAFWGTLKAGAVISLISKDLHGDKLSYILKDSGASLLVCTHKQYTSLKSEYKKGVYPLKNVLVHDYDDVSSSDMIKSFKVALLNQSEIAPPSVVLDIDLASIIYTSGSTGEPKGVMLAHRNMLAASAAINQYLEHNPEDVIISVLPLSFDYGLYQMIMAFSVGATLILEADFTWPTQVLKKIEAYKATVLPVVPSMVPLLKEHGAHFSYDVSSIRCVTNTGAALNRKHIDMLQQQFPSARIYSMYGLTECKRCTYLPPEMIDKKPNSVGVAIPNTELWIVDPYGKRLGVNQIGELVIRGATVMCGYWNKPEQSARKLKKGLLPGEKVLYTGDYCWLDEEGYVYFYGRMDEVLKCRGIKVSPKEVETILMQHASIKEVAVIGVNDDAWGIVLHAFIVLESEVSLKALREYAQARLPSEQRPKFFTRLATLPKSSNGKIDKLQLKAHLSSKLVSLKEMVLA